MTEHQARCGIFEINTPVAENISCNPWGRCISELETFLLDCDFRGPDKLLQSLIFIARNVFVPYRITHRDVHAVYDPLGLLAELIESSLSLVVNNHQGVLSREHNTENDLPQFYIRVQEWDRNELLDTLPLYSNNFPSDKDWVTEVIGQLEQKPDSISVSLLYAGVTTTSTTAQKCAEADNLQSKSGGTRLLNWFSLTTGRHPSVFTIKNSGCRLSLTVNTFIPKLDISRIYSSKQLKHVP
ncbi:uncharacterized protein BYT42DRAFT_550398 [Radiomyces spectabilis]|uniref:uncharacterized protein n=1 Tax=Radiomyces spectabilis TaxID=64574 RepID=UPI00221FAC92|nr:uncharacterized protein BYT42DRAFT_550398 [Radiomyces spectabilis]KAI8364798.1 hypothetical protein BYT42DRAFT_550398 [Radiomyces spectabilis]